MTLRHALPLGALGLVFALATGARGSLDRSLESEARDAVSPDARLAEPARAALRARGAAGLDALFTLHAAAIDALRDGEPNPSLRAALEAVARQRDAAHAHLYWYTDLPSAIAEARRTGKPIVSLRLLGKLDAELSCANSRFFRTVLYANATVSETLRKGFVLHWESVREVPRITIDFGDGRRLERTITGNSLHYVLSPEGDVVEVLPGLMGPGAFLRELANAGPLAVKAGGPGGRELVARAHRERLGVLDQETERVSWPALARLHRDEARLDASSRRLMRLKSGVSGRDFDRTLEAFERSVAEDGVRNEYALRRPIDVWFASGSAPSGRTELAALTDRIYDEVFLTPKDDPWLGLVPDDTYAAIEDRGMVGVASTAVAARRPERPFASAATVMPRAMAKASVEMPLVPGATGAPQTALRTVTNLPPLSVVERLGLGQAR